MSGPRPSTLVTGGAGFIGSELVRQLVQAGHHVRVVDNLLNGRAENLKDVPPAACELVVADIRDRPRMAGALQGIDLVFHLACLGVRHSIHSPQENHDVNAGGTIQLLVLARRAGVRRFVYVSSSEVYGTARWSPMSEDHPTYPATVYGSSKLAGECYARAFFSTHGFSTVVVRPFNTFGPRCHHEGDSGEVIPKFMLRALTGNPLVILGDGEQTRDFTYVTDTARGILLAGTVADISGQTFNLGSGIEISIRELAARVSEVATNQTVTIDHQPSRPGDVLRLCAEASRAKAVLGFRTTVEFRQGLIHLRDWYLEGAIPPCDLVSQDRVQNWERSPVPEAAGRPTEL